VDQERRDFQKETGADSVPQREAGALVHLCHLQPAAPASGQGLHHIHGLSVDPSGVAKHRQPQKVTN